MLAGRRTAQPLPQASIDCAAADYIRLYSLFVFLLSRCHGFSAALLLISVVDYCRTQKHTFSTRGGNSTQVSRLQKQHAPSKVRSVCVMYRKTNGRLLSWLFLLCCGLFWSLLFRGAWVGVHFLFYFEGASSCVLSGCCSFAFSFFFLNDPHWFHLVHVHLTSLLSFSLVPCFLSVLSERCFYFVTFGFLRFASLDCFPVLISCSPQHL